MGVRKQRAILKEEYVASSTVVTESVFITTEVDADEGREVAMFDIPGAYLQTEID